VHLTTGANNASSAISPSFTPTAIGTWCFAGVYSGSTSYNSSADATIDECFKVTTGQSVTTSAPAQATIVTGSADTDVATVTGSVAGGSPAGTVTFYDCGPTTSAAACTSTANQLGTPVNLTAGANDTSTADSVQFTPTALGYWCFASVYSGSTLYAGSTDHTTDECFDVLAHAQGLQILTTSLPPGVKGTAYKVTLSASGGTQPYHWNSTKMPPGIGLNKLTGVIAGNPKKVGTFTITLRVKDRSHPKQSATQIVTLVVTS
jgi:hypothetical protein